MMMEISPRKLQRAALAELHPRYRTDWVHFEPGFEKVRQAFFEAPHLFDQAEVIWQTRTKKVRKVVLPPEYGGIALAFKDYKGARTLRYALRSTKTTLEAVNYRVFPELGIPMAQLVFVGDSRKHFQIRRAFLATRFIEDYVDGRDFLPGGKLRGAPEQKVFIDRNLEYTAKLHSLHCFHGGMRVFNFLWKPLGDGKIDIVWIDVASCCFLRLPAFLFARFILRDLTNFFRDLQLPGAELRDALETYTRCNPRCSLSAEKLFSLLSFTVPRLRP